jgi:hypothetical protein
VPARVFGCWSLRRWRHGCERCAAAVGAGGSPPGLRSGLRAFEAAKGVRGPNAPNTADAAAAAEPNTPLSLCPSTLPTPQVLNLYIPPTRFHGVWVDQIGACKIPNRCAARSQQPPPACPAPPARLPAAPTSHRPHPALIPRPIPSSLLPHPPQQERLACVQRHLRPLHAAVARGRLLQRHRRQQHLVPAGQRGQELRREEHGAHGAPFDRLSKDFEKTLERLWRDFCDFCWPAATNGSGL